MEFPFHFSRWKGSDWSHASRFIIHLQAVIHLLFTSCSDTLGWVTLLTKAFHQNVLKILLSLKLEKCCGMQAVMRTIDASRFSYIKEHQGLAPMHQHDTRLSHLFLWEWQLLLTSISNLDKYRATRSLCSFDKS